MLNSTEMYKILLKFYKTMPKNLEKFKNLQKFATILPNFKKFTKFTKIYKVLPKVYKILPTVYAKRRNF